MSSKRLNFLIARDDLRTTTWDKEPAEEIRPGEARLRVGRFALTANNITYAALGEKFRYWDFFPAPEGFGRMPVWGFADVVESRVEGLSLGERIYGYFPISTDLVVAVDDLSPKGFSDVSPWRADLSAVYNRYLRVSGDPAFQGQDLEALQAVFRPLFATSFLISDFLVDNGLFDARSVIISSASSKTSLALAYLLGQADGGDVEVIGLTSTPNLGFVSGTGYFDRVIDYAQIADMESAGAVLVDMAGNAKLRSAIHHRFGDKLSYSCAVGSAHWEDAGRTPDLPGARPTTFFAPAYVDKKTALWGVDGYERRLADAWTPFCESVRTRLDVGSHRGVDAIDALYQSVLEGRLAPNEAAMGEMPD